MFVKFLFSVLSLVVDCQYYKTCADMYEAGQWTVGRTVLKLDRKTKSDSLTTSYCDYTKIDNTHYIGWTIVKLKFQNLCILSLF